jgi:hypothetical protein
MSRPGNSPVSGAHEPTILEFAERAGKVLKRRSGLGYRRANVEVRVNEMFPAASRS